MDNMTIKLLFVEDSEVDVELALRAIRKEGYEANWTRVELEDDLRHELSEFPPDLILSDFSMPRFDGAQALKVARELAPEVPFVFLSGTIGEERAIDAIRLGATDYVLKNNPRRLGTAIRRALADSAERQLKRANEAERARLVEVLEATSDFVSMSEPDGNIAYLNAAGRKLIGLAESGAIDRRMENIYPRGSSEMMAREAWPAAREKGLWEGETAILDGTGGEIPVSQVIVAHRGPAGDIRFFSTIARDIRERKAYEARIQYYANFDPLTALPNRNLLSDRVAQGIARLQGTRGTGTLIVLNLDRFCRINDSYGHGTGDQLLCTVAERLNDITRQGDTVARLGDDSFAIFTTLSRTDDVRAHVRAIRDAVARVFVVNAQELIVSASMGASIYPRDGANFETLLRNADAAMHRAKQSGDGGFEFYAEAMTRETIERLELENELRAALERGELELHYQPQVSLASGRVIGVEALMRWNHATRGPISPAQFIPIAEDSELINALGEFSLRQACRQLESWNAEGIEKLRVAVNISARHFLSANFLDLVTRTLGDFEIDPAQLEIELTESVLVDDRDAVVLTLKRLKQLGVQIAIDDFGTGYSSLSYLSRLPIDRLKIDQSFVMRISEHGHDAAIAQAIISLAHALGLAVIAEGVETAGQVQFLRAHQCNEGQGYLFARPLPVDQIAPFVSGSFAAISPRSDPKQTVKY